MNKIENTEKNSSKSAMVLRGIQKTFTQGDVSLNVLKGIDLDLRPGTCTALVGSSGSGKSSLLHIAGLLDKPDSGQIFIAGQDVSVLSDRKRAISRKKDIGFVYQFHHLLPEFTAVENVMLPLMIQGKSYKAAEKQSRDLLRALNLDHRSSHRPSRLSGGEQQRIAILRALVGSPTVLLADEPTGNLDVETAHHVFQELMALVKEKRIAALIATHDPTIAAQMDAILYLDHGVLHDKKPTFDL